MRIGIVGAGMAGLAAGLDLVDHHEVTLLESADVPGGLAAGFKPEGWNWPLEHFYHHLFTSDDAILSLAKETGFEDRLLTKRPITAQWVESDIHALDGVLPVLRFSPLPPIDRLRLGAMVAFLKVTRDWRSLEQVTARDWLRRWMGERAYEAVWRPLLLGKFGEEHYDQVPMSWLWARLHKRSMRLMYFEGGFQAFADHLAERLASRGGDLRYGTPVQRIEGDGPTLSVTTGSGRLAFDRVIVTTGPHLLARMAPSLPDAYLRKLLDLDYMGAAVAVLTLDRQLMEEVYWLSLDKREFPFLALVEHTNFIDSRHYGNDIVLYLGDYVPPTDPILDMPEADVFDRWLPALSRINPAFDPAWVQRRWLFRTRYAQPVVPLGFSAHVPPLETPLPGLILASMSQVYPWDRGTNYAVDIGRRAAAAVVDE